MISDRELSCRNLLALLTVGVLVLCLTFLIVQKLYAESLRVTLAQRLNVNQTMSWEELKNYYDCSYVPVGIHASDLFQRSSRLDEILVAPPHERIEFQTREVNPDLVYPTDVVVYFKQFTPLNRFYRINRDGIVTSVSEEPSYYGSDPITCSPK